METQANKGSKRGYLLSKHYSQLKNIIKNSDWKICIELCKYNLKTRILIKNNNLPQSKQTQTGSTILTSSNFILSDKKAVNAYLTRNSN